MSNSPAPTSSTVPYPGRLVVIEGIDGTGKSTLCRALAALLRSRGLDVVESREPTDGPYGRRIRELARLGRDGVSLEEELNLFVQDRKQHIDEVILPQLRAGRTVLLDRYYFSTMAYQGARGADPAEILRLHREFAPEPDLLVILELDVDEALHRVRIARGSAPDAFEGEAYLRRVAELFAAIEHPRLMRLDAREPTDTLARRITDRLCGAPAQP